MATNDETGSNGTVDDTLFTTADTPTGAPAGTQGEGPTPRRRASRRTTKKAAGAPKAASPDRATDQATDQATDRVMDRVMDQPADVAASGDSASDDSATQPQAAERPVRKRAARKKAASPAAAPKRSRARKAAATEQVDGAERAAEAVEELVAVVQAVSAGPSELSTDADAVATDMAVGAAVIDDEADIDEDTEAIAAGVAGVADEPTVADETTEADDEVEDTDEHAAAGVVPSFSLLFQAPDASRATRRRRAAPPAAVEDEAPEEEDEATSADDGAEEEPPRRARRRRGGKGRRGRGAGDEDGEQEPNGEAAEAGAQEARSGETAEEPADAETPESDQEPDEEGGTTRRRRRRRRAGSTADTSEDGPNVSTRVRQPRSDEPVAVKGSTRLEAKKQRRREGREAGRRRTIITEAEFLARRESVDRVMVVRNKDGRTQMGVLEDGVLVEHYIDQATNVSMAGNIYLGRVQNVLPSMEAAFVDIGKGRNAVLYAGEVNWDAAGLEANQPKRIENALTSGQTVLVQVTKDPIGHKGARLTSQISLPGRYLVYVPNSSMTGISRKLPDTERARLKKILRDVVPDTAGVIVRTAAEGASEEELRADVERLTRTWEDIQAQAEAASNPRAGKSKGRKKNGGSGSAPSGSAPMLLHGEPDLTVRVIRDVFNEDFKALLVSGEQAWQEIHPYISSVAPDLADRVTKWTSEEDLFTHHRVDEQIAKAMDRKVWLPSGGSLVIDRTEAMTVVDVNTGKFVGSGGNLEETVTKNNIEAAEEIVRQLRLRDIGGIIVIDFIDMVLESNRDLVVRRLLECLGRDRTKHQVAEVTSLGLVQMTRKRVGSGLIEVFSETCEHCNGRGFIIHADPVDRGAHQHESQGDGGGRRRGGRGSSSGTGTGFGGSGSGGSPNQAAGNGHTDVHKPMGPTAAQIAAAAHAAAIKGAGPHGEPVIGEHGEAAHDGSDGHPHSFPEDSGPWGGDDTPIEEKELDGRPTPEHVELESDLDTTPDASAGPDPAPARSEAPSEAQSPAQSEAALPDAAPEPPAAEPAQPAQAPTRGRRRRGRVVAPAGPPRPSSTAAEPPPRADGE